MTRLDLAATWRTTFEAVRADWVLYATLAAAFVALPAMALDVFGPAPPRTLAELQAARATIALKGGGVPFSAIAQLAAMLVAALAQLAIAGLALGSALTPRDALARGIAALPALVGVSVITALVFVPAVALILASRQGYPAALLPGLAALIPSLFIAARLSLALPLLATRRLGPVAALRASWAATAGNGWRIFGFLAAMLGLLLGVVVVAGGVAAAIGSVFTLAGAGGLGKFLVALVSAAVASGYTVVNSVGLAVVLKRLT